MSRRCRNGVWLYGDPPSRPCIALSYSSFWSSFFFLLFTYCSVLLRLHSSSSRIGKCYSRVWQFSRSDFGTVGTPKLQREMKWRYRSSILKKIRVKAKSLERRTHSYGTKPQEREIEKEREKQRRKRHKKRNENIKNNMFSISQKNLNFYTYIFIYIYFC